MNHKKQDVKLVHVFALTDFQNYSSVVILSMKYQM